MIYVLVGNDTKKKNIFLKTLAKDREVVSISIKTANRELFIEYANTKSMFGDSPVIVVENLFEQNDAMLGTNDFEILKNSPTTFVFIEDKLLVSEEKKYKKYANIERFDDKTVKNKPAFNTFSIADAYARSDKINTWILYREAIEKGVEPEAISGILFWKIKTMILSGTKIFTKESLKHQSSELVSLYHLAHRGERDFVMGLEQFILSSLSK